MKIVISYNNLPIRITDERLLHICTNHPELSNMDVEIENTIVGPDLIQEGDFGELLALKLYPKTPITENKFLVVVYKEDENDGFVITAYYTTVYSKRRKILWKR